MPKVSQRGADLVEPSGPVGFTKMPSGLWTPQQTAAVAGNYEQAYQRTPETLLKVGAQFYPHWHEDAEHLGQASGLGTAGGAAILAQLSPSNEAEQNRIHALQVVHGIDDRQSALLMKAGEHASLAKGAGASLRHAVKHGDTTAASHWQAEYDKHKTANAQLRAKAKIGGTPLGSLSSQSISNALRVRAGEYGDDPLSSLGEVKINDFGRLINDPTRPRSPIDTHYHDVGVGMRTDIPYKTERGLSAKGRYEHFQEASEIARARTNVHMEEPVTAGEFMGGIWYGHIARKVAANPEARKARLASDTKLARIQASKKAQPFLPERFGLRPSLGKIPIPSR